MTAKTRRLRELIAGGDFLYMPSAATPLEGRLAEAMGTPLVYTGGYVTGASRMITEPLLTMDEQVRVAGEVARAVAVPLVADAGAGEPLHTMRTVREFAAAGVAGIHIEDQQLPKRCGHLSGKQLVEPEVMAAKLRAAIQARRDPDFVIVARTDARGVTGFDDAVRRARLYLDVGADAIFPEALESADEFAAFAQAIRAPLLANMTEFGRSPNLDLATLGAMGYRAVLYPLTALRVALRTAQETLAEILKCGHQRERIPQMLTRAELYDLLDYADYEARDRAYFG